MALYGLRIQSVADADLDWFTTDAALQPGRYVFNHHRSSSDVYLSESIPGLILQVGPVLQTVEVEGQEALATPGISEADEKRLRAEYTDGLLTQLSETSSIWQVNPRWVRNLEPA